MTLSTRTTGIAALCAGFALLGAGCAPTQGVTNANANANVPAAQETATATPAEVANTNVNAPAAAAKTPAAPAAKTSFYVEADDKGFYPASGTARKGSIVTVTFKVRTSNVVYNGLDIRSNKNDLGNIRGGTSKSVTFPAEGNISFSGFWPTGAYRGAWTLYVK